MKKFIISVMMILSVCAQLVVPISAAATTHEDVIYDSFEYINNSEWKNWADCFTSEIRDRYYALVGNSENFENNIGILTVTHADVVDIEQVENDYAPKLYPELQPYFANEAMYETYRVCVNLSVDEDNDYFQDGDNYYLVVVVNNNGEWKIGSLSFWPISLSRASRASLYGHLTCGTEPTTINAMDEKGTIHSNISFTDFIVNVTCNEIGNMGYSIDAIKANAMAVKMVGWYFKTSGYYASEGYDISYGWVAYMSTLATTTANTKTVTSAVNAISGYRMVTSTGKLFYASYSAGSSNANGYHSGTLSQNGSNYLSSTYGYDWQEILHYYYDSSSYNASSSVGIVQITNS